MTRQKVVLVTGASSGIGYACALEFAKRGHKVYACARRLEPMEPLKKEGIITLKCDVTDPENVRSIRDLIAEENDGFLDILYNNAGQQCAVTAIDASDKAVAQCYEVNLFAPIRITREFAGLLIKAKGTVGFTGSVTGVVPIPFLAIYSSTKAAIHQYASTLRVEMKPFGVTVLNFVTGTVKTAISDERGLPESLLYQVPGIEESLRQVQDITENSGAMAAEDYAYQTVNDFEREKVGGKLDIYRGGGSFMVRHVLSRFPRFMTERALVQLLKLEPVFAHIEKKYRKVNSV